MSDEMLTAKDVEGIPKSIATAEVEKKICEELFDREYQKNLMRNLTIAMKDEEDYDDLDVEEGVDAE